MFISVLSKILLTTITDKKSIIHNNYSLLRDEAQITCLGLSSLSFEAGYIHVSNSTQNSI